MLTYKQYLMEQETISHVDDFMNYCKEYLNLEEMPELELIPDKDLALRNTSFGGYSPSEKKIYLNTGGRHMADILRTLAHEMVHHKQNLNGVLTDYAGETGSEFENEANSVAGVIMRNYGKENPKIYE